MSQHDLNADAFAMALSGQQEEADQEAPTPPAAPSVPDSIIRRPEREEIHLRQDPAEQFAEIAARRLGGPNFI